MTFPSALGLVARVTAGRHFVPGRSAVGRFVEPVGWVVTAVPALVHLHVDGADLERVERDQADVAEVAGWRDLAPAASLLHLVARLRPGRQGPAG